MTIVSRSTWIMCSRRMMCKRRSLVAFWRGRMSGRRVLGPGWGRMGEGCNAVGGEEERAAFGRVAGFWEIYSSNVVDFHLPSILASASNQSCSLRLSLSSLSISSPLQRIPSTHDSASNSRSQRNSITRPSHAA